MTNGESASLCTDDQLAAAFLYLIIKLGPVSTVALREAFAVLIHAIREGEHIKQNATNSN
jgi:hypothetical protein